MRKPSLARGALIAAALLLAISPSFSADKIKVVATFSVIADMVAEIAGDYVDLVTLVAPGGDTELYQPTVADAAKVAGAKIVFMNGLNDEFEPWLEPLLKQAAFGGVKAVVSRNARTLSSEEEISGSGKPKAAAIDQHAWLDVRNGIVYVKNIAETLSKVDPAHAPDYRARAASYVKQLQSVESWAKTEMAGVPTPKRRIICSHDSLNYIANEFAITLISINGWTNKSEPSAAELAKLTDQIRREHVRALFLDSITDPRAMLGVARETGASIGGTLYGDALSAPEGEAGTYIAMLRHDVATLKAGMLKN